MAIQIELLLAGIIGNNGLPLCGGKVWTYGAGTTTLKETWLNPDETSVASNPIHLDCAGRAQVYGNGIYKFRLETEEGEHIVTFDQVKIEDITGDGGTIIADGTLLGQTLYWNGLRWAVAPSLFSENKEVKATGTLWSEGNNGDIPTIGPGVRAMWIPSKQALRAGKCILDEWDEINIGQGSTGIGEKVKIKGANSLGIGKNIEVMSVGSFGIGEGIEITGKDSGGIGSNISITSTSSFGIGNDITINNSDAMGWGGNIEITSTNSFAIGNDISITAKDAMAIGFTQVNAIDKTIKLGTNNDTFIHIEDEWDKGMPPVLKPGRVGIRTTTPKSSFETKGSVGGSVFWWEPSEWNSEIILDETHDTIIVSKLVTTAHYVKVKVPVAPPVVGRKYSILVFFRGGAAAMDSKVYVEPVSGLIEGTSSITLDWRDRVIVQAVDDGIGPPWKPTSYLKIS